MHGTLALSLMAAASVAQAPWPIECDSAEGWRAEPGWVGNPAAAPTLEAEGGVITFTVSEPGRGTKWTLPVAGLNADMPGYLLARCRAESIRAGGPYVLWAISGESDGSVIAAGDFPVDGRWHDVAVDLFAAGRRGRIHTLAVEVQAGDQAPARLSFDYLRIVDEVPEGAVRLPVGSSERRQWREEFDGDLQFRARPDWLGNPADDEGFELRQTDGRLIMRIDQPGRGMKWSTEFAEPVDLTGMGYFTIRYRAVGAASWGDYFVWVGSETGGQPRQATALVQGTQVRADGRWHTEAIPVDPLFPVKELAVQLQAEAPGATAEIEYIAASGRRPLLPLDELFMFARGWTDLRLADGAFTCVAIASACNGSGADLARWFWLSEWLDDAQVTVDGIPFELTRDGADLAVVPRNSSEPFIIPVGQKARELFLLMAARLPAQDYTGGLGGLALRSFRAPERLRIAVDYADGVTDWHFPARAADGVYEFSAGLDAYVLPGLRHVKVRQIRLRSAMKDSIIAVAAITAHRGGPVARTEPPTVLPPYSPPRRIGETPPELRLAGDRLVFSNAYLRVDFSMARGIRLDSLENHCLRAGQMRLTPGPIFTLVVDETQVDSTQVSVGDVRQDRSAEVVAVTIPVDAQGAGVPLSGELTMRLGKGPELEMALRLKHVGSEVIRPGIMFPQLNGVVLGDVDNTWYMDCARGGVISDRPTWIVEPYCGRNPLQVTDVFSPRLGGGLYLMVHDLADIYKYYALGKREDGVLLRVDYFPRDYRPGEEIEIAPAVIGAHTGDWRVALDAYKRCVASWHKPAVPRKQWFQECFNYRQHLVRAELYDFEAGAYDMNEVLRKDIEFFGRVDYFHIFDFGQSLTYGRVGDYSHYDEIGGREKLAEAIRGVQEAGARVGLYIEGYLVDERGEFGRDHVEDWHIIRPNGEPLLWPGAPTEHMMCPAARGWQDYLAETYRRVTSELNPDGMYIDQHGFADGWKICYSADHGHPVPQAPLRGEREMGRKIRAAVPERIATLTEEVPVDVNSQYQDGALAYSVAQANTQLAPHRVHLFRFCFPDFKVFQLVSYNPFIDGGWERLKFPFFNGEGMWLGNSIPGGFDADAQAFLRKSFALLHEHREAFTSDDVAPLVPTENPLVCANRFSGPDETVWTLINVGFSTYRGPVLSVPHTAGARYVDLWHSQPIRPVIKNGHARLSVEIGPREVGCVAQIIGG